MLKLSQGLGLGPLDRRDLQHHGPPREEPLPGEEDPSECPFAKSVFEPEPEDFVADVGEPKGDGFPRNRIFRLLKGYVPRYHRNE